ncbi:hypothetical protein [Aureispira anguillae]|uniref:Uncharacterized protein n=1 Tax=Aureispira anguillae TaxID=2864201 RepID=A0A915YFU3_9BACT|nr:hypothetical protein [Aureispira anguillae]BDS12262.1 hypothetical protein AsAng_0029810 [Aureispira anguillae]
MNQLLLSSQRLETCKVLQNGKLNLFEALQKIASLELVNLEVELPESSIILEWKEVQTPATPQSFKDLVGKKLGEYKFQYLGRFIQEETPVEVKKEQFVARFPTENITDDTIENTGWVNCTWLIDFLVGADKIEKDGFRKEFLIWRKDEAKKEYTLALSRESIHKASAEQEKFVFNEDLKTIAWDHQILFSGQQSC